MVYSSLIRALTVLVVAGGGSVYAQPSPEVQRRITAAIEAVANASAIDYTVFVNPFIGTGTWLSVTKFIFFGLRLHFT